MLIDSMIEWHAFFNKLSAFEEAGTLSSTFDWKIIDLR